MKIGDKLVLLCNLVKLQELADIRDQKLKELRLQIWMNRRVE